MAKSAKRPVQKFRKDGRCSKGAAGYGYFMHEWEVIRKTKTHDIKQCIHCGGLKWICARGSSTDVDDTPKNTGSRAAQQERNQALDDAVLSIMAELKAEGKL